MAVTASHTDDTANGNMKSDITPKIANASGNESTATITRNGEATENARPQNEEPQLTDTAGLNHNGNTTTTHEKHGNVLPIDKPTEPSSQPVLWPVDTTNSADHPHAETESIIRQVEYYFSDENLCGDAHLLSRTGPTGDGWVSINEILGFKKMRSFKPKSRVKASLKLSDKLELHNNKFIRRKAPLGRPPTVIAKVSEKRERDAKLVEKPWLTKGILAATGFESGAIEGPLSPADYDAERKLFDPEESFPMRIDRAITRYMSKRKWHQKPRLIFTKFILFGGFTGGQRSFTGGLDSRALEDFDKEEIEMMKAEFAVAEQVLDGLDPAQEGGQSWVVDFEGMAKAFLSSHFFQHFDWNDQETVLETTNVLRNFYNYLLIHEVCPEYVHAIKKAMDVCHLAVKELPQLAKLDQSLPGNFNIACSTLHGGTYVGLRPSDPNADWVLAEDAVIGLSDKDAWLVFTISVSAHCNDEQLEALANALKTHEVLEVVTEEEIGLEIVSIEHAEGDTKAFYNSDHLKDTSVLPAGKLHCIRWDVPQNRWKDLPKYVLQAEKLSRSKKYEFIVEEETLRFCQPGMKFEAIVKKLGNGLMWVDAVDSVYPTFFTWTLNERALDWKEPGPPKDWMVRQNEKKQGGMVKEVVKAEQVEETPV